MMNNRHFRCEAVPLSLFPGTVRQCLNYGWLKRPDGDLEWLVCALHFSSRSFKSYLERVA
jgi:hypothetical protein